MHAQNEPPALEVHAREPVGEPTDVPGAYVVERVDIARMRPMSRASQLAALVVGSRDGERILDACAAPGGKTLLLAGEITAVEVHPGRARQLAEEMPANVRVVTADVRELDESGFDRALVDAPCSGLGVLARRPDLRWRAKPLPELQLELLQAAAERTKPGGTIVYAVCTLNADENEAVVDALGLPVEPLGDEWPAVRTSDGGRSSCSRAPTATGRRGSSSRACVTSPDALARLDPDGRGGAVALRGRLLAPRRADRRSARRGLPRLPLRRRRRAFRRADHDRADRAAVDLAARPRARRRARRAPDGRASGEVLRGDRRCRRRQRHLPLRGRRRRAGDDRRRARARPAGRCRLQPGDGARAGRRRRRRRGPRALHVDPSRVLGPAVPRGDLRPCRAPARSAAGRGGDPGGRRRRHGEHRRAARLRRLALRRRVVDLRARRSAGRVPRARARTSRDDRARGRARARRPGSGRIRSRRSAR